MEIEYVHFYVDDALAWRQWFVDRFGFWSAGGWQDDHSHHERVCSGSVRFLLSSALSSAGPVARYLALHPPGVVDIALRVQDLESLLQRARALGARIVLGAQAETRSPTIQTSSVWAIISGWGPLQHTLIAAEVENPEVESLEELSNLSQCPSVPTLPPQLHWPKSQRKTSADLFQHIDHVVLNVAAGALDKAVQWYSELLGLRSRQSFHIRTPYSGLRSQVLADDSPHPSHKQPNCEQVLQFPINEPESPTSQIQDFLDRNRGPGIQHIALGTQTLLPAVARLRQQQISFLAVPPSYYRRLPLRPHFEAQELGADWADIVAQQVLVDWHPERLEGPLLQIFTRPIFAEPTFFFELIERRQAKAHSSNAPGMPSYAKPPSLAGCAQGFGEGNFQALFEAMELEQLNRTFAKP